jgi:hypothetical protein
MMALALGLTGCVDDDKMFFIRQNQEPDSSCTVSTSATTIALAGGVFDLKPNYEGGRFSYLMNPLVENQMLSTTGDNQPERNRLHMRRFDIELEMEGAGSLGEKTQYVSGVIDPGGTYAIAGLPVIPPEIIASVQQGNIAMVQVKLRAIAERSGDNMESADFIYPVRLCSECIVDWKEQCPASDSTDSVLKNPCGLPQDQPVTCCRTAAGVTCLSDAK